MFEQVIKLRICIFFLVNVAFFSCSNDPELVRQFVEKKDFPIEIINGAEILQTENGILKIKIVASNIKRFEDIQPNLLLSNGIEVTFYKDSAIRSVLNAEKAEIYESSNIMIASDNVVLVSSEGKRMNTEELIWDEKKNKIYTDKQIVITTDKEIIKGEGFESNPDFSEYSIAKINGTFNL